VLDGGPDSPTARRGDLIQPSPNYFGLLFFVTRKIQYVLVTNNIKTSFRVKVKYLLMSLMVYVQLKS